MDVQRLVMDAEDAPYGLFVRAGKAAVAADEVCIVLLPFCELIPCKQAIKDWMFPLVLFVAIARAHVLDVLTYRNHETFCWVEIWYKVQCQEAETGRLLVKTRSPT